MIKRILLICFIQFAYIAGYAQCDCNVKGMIQKIDSIAIANDIILGEVVFIRANYDGQDWSKIAEFKFDGGFLVLNGVYYNMNKLLYFNVKKDYFVFFFQTL